jgi:TATA-binding protein-associated factor
MGRLTGIPYFLTEASHTEEKDDETAIRKAKKLDDDGETALAEQLAAVKRRQTQMEGRFLRRSTDSLDYNGSVLVPLPPYKEILGVVKLTERETDIIQERAAAAKAQSVPHFVVLYPILICL